MWTPLRVVLRPFVRALRLLLVMMSGLGLSPPPLLRHEDAVVQVAKEAPDRE